MKKFFVLSICLLSVLISRSQVIVFTGGCWDIEKGNYNFTFVESGEGQSNQDMITYHTNYNAEVEVPVYPVNGVYHVSVDKTSVSQMVIIYVFVNHFYVGQKADDTTKCGNDNNNDKRFHHRGKKINFNICQLKQ